jgi:hypothetical protein
VWNVQVEPLPYLQRLEDFCRRNGMVEADWYERAVALLS